MRKRGETMAEGGLSLDEICVEGVEGVEGTDTAMASGGQDVLEEEPGDASTPESDAQKQGGARLKTVLRKKPSIYGVVTAASAANDFLKKRVRTTSNRHGGGRRNSYQPPVITTHRRGRDADIEPVVNGMKCFGIGKQGIARAVVKFTEPPTRHPCTLCFHFPSTFLTHRYVLDMVRSKIHFVPEAKVRSIQYVDRNTIHGTQGLDNRWLITVSNVEGRDELLRLGLHIYNRRIALRRYDDILQDEYREYLQYQDLQKKLYVRLQEMAQVQKAVNVQPSSHIQSMAEELRKALGMKDPGAEPPAPPP